MSRIDELIAELCPDGVEFVALGELGKRNKGTSITASRMKAIREDGGVIRVFAGGKTIADVAEKSVPGKDVIRVPSIIVKSRGHIGFTYYDRPFTHKAELWSYSINRSDVDQRFVYYYLLTQIGSLQELARATSVKLPQLGVDDTDRLRIPVPPLPVQREIVKVLDAFTELETELEAELGFELEARRRQYQYYRDALLSFAEPTTSTQISARWKTLGEVGKFIRGRRFTKADYVDHGIGVIHYGEIYTHYGTSADTVMSHVRSDLASSLRFAQPGDVVITDVGETVEDVGKAVAWIGSGQVAIHDHCYAFRHSMNPKFVSYCMQTSKFRSEKAKYVARTKVNTLLMDGFAKIAIPVPPLDEQGRIVAILDNFDALVSELSISLPGELKARRGQYVHYRDRLLSFREAE
jgi:type I restriction enzyme, S subunit